MKKMYGPIEGKTVKAYLSFQVCSKLPTIQYRGNSAVLCKWVQMGSTREDSESRHLCSYLDTKIEVVTMKNIRARFFSML